MTMHLRTVVLLSVTTMSCISAQRQKLNDEYLACMRERNRDADFFRYASTDDWVNAKLQRTSDLDDRAFEVQVESCKAERGREAAERERARAEEEKKQKAAEAEMAAAKKARNTYYLNQCAPLELQTMLLCQEKIEELSRLFQFNDGICKSAAKLLHDACPKGAWDPVLSEQDLTTRGVLMADYESRTVLGACLLQSNNTLELEYASNETRTKCLALAGAVKGFLVAATVKTKLEGDGAKKSAAGKPQATPRPR